MFSAANHRSGLRRRRCGLEPLEDRRVLATLGLGVIVLDSAGDPQTTPITVGETFTVQIAVEDQRDDPQGLVALPINLSWDATQLTLLNPPTANAALPLGSMVTDVFELSRFVGAVTDASLTGLQGAADPSDDDALIGVNNNLIFANLQFRAEAVVDDTPLRIEVSGSVSFDDGDSLDGVDPLADEVRQLRLNEDGTANQAPLDEDDPNVAGDPLAITEFLDIVAPVATDATLSGFVYTDRDFDGLFEAGAGEVGIPRVALTLAATTGQVLTTSTDDDGFYRFVAPAGEYDLVETQPSRFVDASLTVGSIDPADAPAAVGTADGFNRVTGVVLTAGSEGTEYNFGENAIPTKRFFLASADRVAEIGRLTALEAIPAETATVATLLAAPGEPAPQVALSVAPVAEDLSASIDTVATTPPLAFFSTPTEPISSTAVETPTADLPTELLDELLLLPPASLSSAQEPIALPTRQSEADEAGANGDDSVALDAAWEAFGVAR